MTFQVCESSLETAQRCLYYPRRGVGASSGAICECLSREVANHLVVTILLTIDKVQGDAVKVSMLRAYLLALFSHLLAKFVGDVYLALHGPEAMRDLFDGEAKVLAEGDTPPPSEDEAPEAQSDLDKQDKKKKKFRDFFR